MALIRCVECQGSVSTLAAACPHCGAPVSANLTPTAALSPEVVAPAMPQLETPGHQSAALPIDSKPAAQSRPPSLDAIFRLKMLGLVLILAGIGYMAYLVVTRPTPQRKLGEQPDLSAESADLKWRLTPSFVLFVAGGAAFNAARVRQNAIEARLRDTR